MDPLLTEDSVAALEELAPLKADLLRGEHLAVALGQLRQERINRATAAVEHSAVEGLGELTARIDRKLFINLGTRFGFEAWNDPGFLDSVLRKNPGMRVRQRARKTTLRVSGLREVSHGAAARGDGRIMIPSA